MICFKGDNTNLIQDLLSFFDMVVDEVIENIPIPGIILAFLTVVKFVRNDGDK
jgi:hypothetical protein